MQISPEQLAELAKLAHTRHQCMCVMLALQTVFGADIPEDFVALVSADETIAPAAFWQRLRTNLSSKSSEIQVVCFHRCLHRSLFFFFLFLFSYSPSGEQ